MTAGGDGAEAALAWWREFDPRERRLARDEPLFHRGDPVTAMFRVEEGRVRLERRTIEGGLLVLQNAGSGALLAEASLFAEVYHCDASAAEPAVVSVYPRAAIVAAMKAEPERLLQYARLLAGEVQSLRHRLEFRNVRSARDRLLLYLELHADAATRSFTITGTLQDIAFELGLSREALYRTLAALEKEGLVRRSGGCILLARPT